VITRLPLTTATMDSIPTSAYEMVMRSQWQTGRFPQTQTITSIPIRIENDLY